MAERKNTHGLKLRDRRGVAPAISPRRRRGRHVSRYGLRSGRIIGLRMIENFMPRMRGLETT